MRKLLYSKKYTLKENLFSAALGIVIALPAVLGLYFHNHQPSQEVQARTEVETVKLHPLVGAPQKPETAAQSTPPTETEPPTCAPEYIMSEFEVYDFVPLSAELQAEIQTACAKYEIAYDLILAIIKTESEFDSAVIGDSGRAYGLMQIQPQWWDKLAADKGLPDYRTDAAQNAELGVAILSLLLTENGGDLNKALIAYNGGEDYPERVYANYEWILEQGENDGYYKK